MSLKTTKASVELTVTAPVAADTAIPSPATAEVTPVFSIVTVSAVTVVEQPAPLLTIAKVSLNPEAGLLPVSPVIVEYTSASLVIVSSLIGPAVLPEVVTPTPTILNEADEVGANKFCKSSPIIVPYTASISLLIVIVLPTAVNVISSPPSRVRVSVLSAAAQAGSVITPPFDA